MRQAVILAGGSGTRLRERLGDLPKPLIDVCGKPLLERQIELLKQHGFQHVLLLVNYGAQKIIDFCASKQNWGLRIDCMDDGEPLGTAGATLAVLPHLEEDFLVMYGDTMMDVNLSLFRQFHEAHPAADATIFVHPNDHPHDSDLVDVDAVGRILEFHPYPHDPGRYYPNLVSAALYYLRRKALERWRGRPGKLDFGKDVFPDLLKQGSELLAYNSIEYIKDCGTPNRLDKVCGDLMSGRIRNASLEIKQAAVFLDRDGTLNREVEHLRDADQFVLLPDVSKAIQRFNRSNYRTVVVTNQPVLARGDCSPEELKRIHDKMETLLGRDGAYLDRIYYCPHHPDRGFAGEVPEFKVACECRKPAIGMVRKAEQELNIDLGASWFIGDTTVDVMTAHRADIRSILVETGHAGLDRRHGVFPDFTVPDLSAAAAFILEAYPRLMALCEGQIADVCQGDFVFIGGLSRAGKSNFAHCVRDSLKNRGRRAVLIPLDGWLKNEEERTPGVRGRYDLKGAASLLKSLAERTGPFDVKLQAYDKLKRRQSDGPELRIEPDDVVIFEGTLALSLVDSVPNERTHTWFVQVDEPERKRRVVREYIARGLSDDAAEAVYISRQVDEVPIITATQALATYRVDLGLT